MARRQDSSTDNRYEALLRVADLVNFESDLHEVLLGVRKAILEVLGFDRCGIFLVDEVTGLFRGSVGTDPNGELEDIRHQVFPIQSGEGYAMGDLVLSDQQYLFRQDAYADEVASAADPASVLPIHEHAVVAARTRGRTLAVIAVDNLLTNRPFDETDVRDLLPFAGQAATAIHNAQLLADSRRRSEELEAVIYMISHDLRAPLVSIEGYSSGLLRKYGGDLPGDARHRLERIVQNASQLQKFISEVLAYSRAGTGTVTEEVHLDEIADQVVELIEPAAELSGVAIKIEPDMPIVPGSRLQLHQLLQNLVDNAVKASAGRPGAQVTIGARELPSRWYLYVQDNGPGMSDADRDRIFNLFQTGSAGKPGHGVGLAIVKKIAESHGGTVWVESDGPDRGATFIVALPKFDVAPSTRG